MAPTFRKLHPHFVAEVSAIELRRVHDHETLAEIRDSLGRGGHGVRRHARRLRRAGRGDEGAARGLARRSLYLASHASRIVDWPIPEGRLLLHELMEHATQVEFVYRHSWRVGDLVVWDNRATMHRAWPFDDTKYIRELRRVTTLDVEEPSAIARR